MTLKLDVMVGDVPEAFILDHGGAIHQGSRFDQVAVHEQAVIGREQKVVFR
jgi:hypothetical protein